MFFEERIGFYLLKKHYLFKKLKTTDVVKNPPDEVIEAYLLQNHEFYQNITVSNSEISLALFWIDEVCKVVASLTSLSSNLWNFAQIYLFSARNGAQN